MIRLRSIAFAAAARRTVVHPSLDIKSVTDLVALANR
jgi:hypothetical protein